MAAAKAVFTQSPWPKGQDMTQRRMILAGTLAITASPATYTLGGIPITFAPNSNNQGGIDLPGFSNPGAIRGELYSRSGSGYIYFWTTTDLWTAVMKGNVLTAGQSIVDTNGNIQTVTTGGTAGSGAEPTWAIPTAAVPNPTTVDNTVTWTCEGPSSGLVQIFQSGAENASALPLVEIANATTIVAGISGDVISARLEFLKG